MLYIASDHAGFELKEYVKRFLAKLGITATDLGAHAYKKTDDYPDFAIPLARKVAGDSSARGILICGSGQGVCIAANRIKKVRAALAWDVKSATASRNDDDANVLCLAGRMLSQKKAGTIVLSWLFTGFSGLTRHRRRIEKIDAIEKKSR